MNKLIKILDNHFIVIESVNNIKTGEWIYDATNNTPIYQSKHDIKHYSGFKVIRSTQLLEGVKSLNKPTIDIFDLDVSVLYRPVGPLELDLIGQLNLKEFPPRLPSQPFFYPVTNEQYAIQITRDWNIPAYGSGFVTMFFIDTEYISQFDIQNVGGFIHNELWIPSEKLNEFNKHIIGIIHII